MGYEAYCEEHSLKLIDGRCDKCRDAEGKTFLLDMQSIYLREGAMADKWLTYEREWSGETSSVTCLSTEKRPTGFGLPPRPATETEIKEEIAKREKREEERKERAAFEARQDYKDAEDIRQLLELMNFDNHPLDRLTPAEWAELRKRLDV